MKRKGRLFAAALAFLAAMTCVGIPCFRAAGPAAAPREHFPKLPEGQRFKLVWSDEFDGDKLDESKWDVPEGVRRDGWWRRDAISLDGKGRLLMTTFKDGDKYIDGCVRTREKFEHTFGYYVVRAKLHGQEGHWPAFWLYNGSVGNIGNGGTDGAEIDIFEKPTRDYFVNHAIHWDGYGEFHKQSSTQSIFTSVMRGFHTFALLWTEKEYVFYVDGKEAWRTDAGGPCRVPLYIKLSDEIGKWAGDISKARLPDVFTVDYVRVYDIVNE